MEIQPIWKQTPIRIIILMPSQIIKIYSPEYETPKGLTYTQVSIENLSITYAYSCRLETSSDRATFGGSRVLETKKKYAKSKASIPQQFLKLETRFGRTATPKIEA